MCAAPGSKTAQLMEMVSAPTPTPSPASAPGGAAAAEGKGAGGDDDDDGDVGLVVANDSDRDRAYMLAHQCKRVKSPAICITWCPAQLLPNLGAAEAERGSDKGGCFFFVCVWRFVVVVVAVTVFASKAPTGWSTRCCQSLQSCTSPAPLPAGNNVHTSTLATLLSCRTPISFTSDTPVYCLSGLQVSSTAS